MNVDFLLAFVTAFSVLNLAHVCYARWGPGGWDTTEGADTAAHRSPHRHYRLRTFATGGTVAPTPAPLDPRGNDDDAYSRWRIYRDLWRRWWAGGSAGEVHWLLFWLTSIATFPLLSVLPFSK